MPIFPIRGLAAKGVLRDPSAYQLDLDAWSACANVRFHSNKVERAPIFRTVYDAFPEEPVFCVGLETTSGVDKVITAGADGRLWAYQSGGITEVTPSSGYTTGIVDPAFTATTLGDVLYVNRPNQAPVYFGPSSTAFTVLPNMETTWTCRSLRAYGDYLVALNVTKPATYVDPYSGLTLAGGPLPNLVKWSDLTLDGQVPDSWDPDDPTKSTGENPLEELTTALVDGKPMRNIMVLYSENDVWGMAQSGDNNIFDFYRLFSDGGMIAPNCCVEVEGVHYVFGPTDIYRHDGVTKQSIIDKRNKQAVFRNLNIKNSEVCFVAYLPQYDSIVFGYNTGDASATFQGCDRCNQGAVYDIRGDTWSFIDLPNVSAMTLANLDMVLTYASATVTYAQVGGSYYDQTNSFVKSVVACSGAVSGLFTNSRVLAYDFMNKGSLPFPYAPECNAPAYVERSGMALDQLGSDLTTAKKLRRVFPLVSSYDPTVPVEVLVGSAMTPAGSPGYTSPITFDPVSQYKVDCIKSGRYLAIRFTVSSAADFEVAGFDLDVEDNGHR